MSGRNNPVHWEYLYIQDAFEMLFPTASLYYGLIKDHHTVSEELTLIPCSILFKTAMNIALLLHSVYF